MRIRHKIFLGYLALIASAVVLVVFFLATLGDISARYTDLIRRDQRILLLVNNLRSGVQREIVTVRTFELRPDVSLQYEYHDMHREQQQALNEIDPMLTQQDDQDSIKTIKASITKYTDIADKVMTFPSAPLPVGAPVVPITPPSTGALNYSAFIARRQIESETARLNLMNVLDSFIYKKNRQVEQAQASLGTKVEEVSAQLLILSLLGGLGALIGAILLTESFTAPLRRLMRNIQGISSGDLQTAVAVRSRDEVGELAGVLETMRRRLAHTAAENSDLLNSAREEAEKLAKTRQDLEEANVELQEALAVESEARRRIEEIDRLKSEFASMISHELKTPVSYVYNYAGALKEHNNNLNEGQRTEFITAIQGEAQHMLTLIDDIMAVSLLESVGLSHRFVETDLRKLLNSVVKDQQITTRRHQLTVKGPDNLPVCADPTRLKQVLNNLISNAIKYSPQGGPVEVRLRANALDKTAMVYVRDYGIGIDPEDAPKLFDRFMRIQRKETMAIPGSGLGLYIAHHIIQAHGGTLKLEPAPGKGTIAEITVPLIDTTARDEAGSEEDNTDSKNNKSRKDSQRQNGNANGHNKGLLPVGQPLIVEAEAEIEAARSESLEKELVI